MPTTLVAGAHHTHRTRVALSAIVWISAAAMTACELEPIIVPAPCPAARQTSDDECCDALESARGTDCQPRIFGEVKAPSEHGEDASALVTAVDGRGHVLLAWAEADRVWLMEGDGSSVTFSQGPKLDGTPLELDLAAGPKDELLLSWRQGGFTGENADDAAIFLLERARGGLLVARPEPLSAGTDAYQPRVAIGSAGDAVITWNQWTGEHYGVALASAAAVGEPYAIARSESDVLSPPVFFSNAPRLAVDDRGGFIITWYQSVGGPLLTFKSERASRSDPPTRPAPTDFISADGAPVDSDPVSNPKVAIGPNGVAAIAWTQDDGTGKVAVYLATRDGAGTWYTPDGLGDALGDHSGHARSVELAFGAAGELFVAWEQDERIVLATRAADGSWLTPHGSPQVVSSPGAQALDPALATGPAGGALLAFREREAGGVFRVVALRATSTAPELGQRVVVSDDSDGDAQAPRAAIGGGDERALIAWLSGAPQRVVRYSELLP